jgi:type III restriction enzyme
MEFATTETEVHQAEIKEGPPLLSQDLLASITNKVITFAKLPEGFAGLYPIVQAYVVERCFGRAIDIEKEKVRFHLRSPFLQEGIAKYLARKIGELTANCLERRELCIIDEKEQVFLTVFTVAACCLVFLG